MVLPLLVNSIASSTAPTPHAALPSVKKSARWNSLTMEKWRLALGCMLVPRKGSDPRYAPGTCATVVSRHPGLSAPSDDERERDRATAGSCPRR